MNLLAMTMLMCFYFDIFNMFTTCFFVKMGYICMYITMSNLPSPESGHLSTIVSEAFVRFFVELVGHYPLFITGEREDGYSSSSSSPASCFFQREGFRKAIPSKTVRRFLEIFMETQMFGWFIQERELHKQALRGTAERIEILSYNVLLVLFSFH